MLTAQKQAVLHEDETIVDTLVQKKLEGHFAKGNTFDE